MAFASSPLLVAILLGISTTPSSKLLQRATSIKWKSNMQICDYVRGEDDNQDIDSEAVERLISRRTQFRKTGDFQAADQIRDELNQMGVTLWDRDRVWMVGDAVPKRASFSGRRAGGRRYGGPEPEFRRLHRETRIFVENLSYNTEWQQLKDHFINAGYPTVYASVSYDKENQRSKGCGLVQFETRHAADDAVQHMTGSILDGRSINCRPDQKEQYRSDDGYNVPDYSKHARRENRKSSSPRQRAFNLNGHDYTRHPEDHETLDEDKLGFINELLRLRLDAKLVRDFDVADDLLVQLQTEHGVTVNDGCKQWRADGKSFERRYTRDASCGAHVDEDAVSQLLEERAEARKNRNYPKADAIMKDLYEVHRVIINDDEKRWRVVDA